MGKTTSVLWKPNISRKHKQYCTNITWFIYSLFIKAHLSWIIITIMTHTEWWRCQIPTLSIRKCKKINKKKLVFRQEIMTFLSQYSRITWFLYSLFIKAHQSWIIITIMTQTEWWRCQIKTLSIRKRKKYSQLAFYACSFHANLP